MAKTKKVKIEFNPSTMGDDLAKLVKSASDARLKIEGYSDEIAGLRTKAKEELGVDTKMFNTQLGLYHKGTRERFEDEKTEAVELYDTLFPK
ncbi:transcriptional regulator [Pectobacterium bacteriophage PM2]|uniref:DsDNA binding protein n=1 Tax=Pectobacterium bacteriophage PM2 TaxID=1429794 RepID=A0A0A0Q2I0_9CAUD|nr:transcriptional regulator [Pectobacterium bacteriophage PM2]AHY25230.1 dsDNA binding protein [Pectobacterium bacteriophage PM2]